MASFAIANTRKMRFIGRRVEMKNRPICAVGKRQWQTQLRWMTHRWKFQELHNITPTVRMAKAEFDGAKWPRQSELAHRFDDFATCKWSLFLTLSKEPARTASCNWANCLLDGNIGRRDWKHPGDWNPTVGSDQHCPDISFCEIAGTTDNFEFDVWKLLTNLRSSREQKHTISE